MHNTSLNNCFNSDRDRDPIVNSISNGIAPDVLRRIATGFATADTGEVILPSSAEIAQLLEFTQNAQLTRLVEHLEKLVQTEPKYRKFAEQIIQLANDFCFE